VDFRAVDVAFFNSAFDLRADATWARASVLELVVERSVARWSIRARRVDLDAYDSVRIGHAKAHRIKLHSRHARTFVLFAFSSLSHFFAARASVFAVYFKLKI
jgi:hypothetical protein